MKDGFDFDEWARLTPSDRIYRCFWMAAEGQRLAESASPKLAALYREIARKWLELAVEIADSDGRPH